jgi:hypothetical protein
MTVWYKQGVLGDLQTVARKGLGRVANLFNKSGEDLFVTSLRDGNHSGGSLHYDGLAFDIRPSDKVLLVDIINVLGPDWDVIYEGNHIHCEYDPKG